MKFYKLTDVPIRKGDQVFKIRPLGRLIATILSFSAAITLVVLRWRGSILQEINIPPFFWWYIAAVLAVTGLFCLAALRASLKPGNWLLRCNQKGLFIKYRSYRNWRLPADDVQVVGLDYPEVAWAWQVKERRNSPGLDGGKRLEFITYLDVGLVDPDTAVLEQHLEAERNRKWNTLHLHYPVEVLPGGIIRLEWRRAGGGVYPSAALALKSLSRYIKIAPPTKIKTDLAHEPGASPEDEESKIQQLLKSGDKMGAVRLTREIYNCSLSEAMAHVDKMTE